MGEVPKWQGAVAGVLAGAAALSAGELASAFGAPRPGPVTAVANRVIDNAPNWFVDFGKSVFGLNDKIALGIGTVLIALVIAAGLGVASRRNTLPGIVGITLFGVVGALAIATDVSAGIGAAIIFSAVAVIAGVLTLLVLIGAAQAAAGRPADDSADSTTDVEPASMLDPPVSRRGFIGVASATAAVAGLAGLGARSIRGRSAAAAARENVVLAEAAADELDALVARVEASPVAQVPGITPTVVPNDDFYRIDTAFLVPQVDPETYKLTIGGMVDREVTYTYQELLDRATTVDMVTLSCVSNQIGGDLVGNAVWQGVPLIDLLNEAGVQPEATQISSTSVDGWSCGFPTEAAFDGRTALVAVAMNGEPLPIEHGFPVRLVVSGLYGYVSATKWLEKIELTTLEDFDGYWVPRGWSKLGPVKTQSRIDTPGNGANLVAGSAIPIAGVAWAPDTGIERVEVKIGDNDWQEAELTESLGPNAWRQWSLNWETEPGNHVISVRATDASGYTQTPDITDVAPNGATGWHTISVSV